MGKAEEVDFIRGDGKWDTGTRETPRETHRDPITRDTADVRDERGDLHKDVTITRNK